MTVNNKSNSENGYECLPVRLWFILCATMMYYFINNTLYIGVGITYRHLFALVIIASALVLFMAKPNFPRALVSVRFSFAFALPLGIILLASMLVWLINQTPMSIIFRGISGCIFYTNRLSCSLAAGALLYVFGERGIYFNLISLLCANLLMIATIIMNNGLGAYLSELLRLVLSFAGDTGEIIVNAEIHELAFCMGAYLIYMLMRFRKKLTFILLLAATSFCFISAFKRIAMVAMAAVFAVIFPLALFSRRHKKSARVAAYIITVIIIALLIIYIGIIKSGLFEKIEAAGIDTSGRAFVYRNVGKYYEFSPAFLGNGIGYLTYRLNESIHLGVTAVHNDFLQFYIDLGFFGYILWLISMSLYQVVYFAKGERTDTALVALAQIIYLFIVSSTDNTINYPLLTTVTGIIIMGDCYTAACDKARNKIFGSIDGDSYELGTI